MNYTPARTAPGILCIDQFSQLGGGQRSLLDLLPALSELGWRPCLAVPGDGPFPESVRSLGYSTYSFASGPYRSKKKTLAQHFRYASELPAIVRSFVDIIKTNKIDLIYVNGPRYVPPAAWVGWRTGTPVVFHSHNRPQQSSALALAGQALELASAHVIACCQYTAEPFREYIDSDRLRIIYNGVAEMSAGLSRKAHNKIKTIGVIGRIEEEKGQLPFVQAAARLIAMEDLDCQFRIIGSPMFSGTKYYKKVLAASAGLPIQFVEWRENMAEVYSNLDLVIVPSSTVEATTRVIPEAYSAGLPVVAFPVGGIPEILNDGETGFLAKDASVQALAERIRAVIRMDPDELAAVVARARNHWAQRFTLETYRANVCAVLARALKMRLVDPYSAVLTSAEV